MSATSLALCTSFSNVLSWKISLEDWIKIDEGEFFLLQFETMVPPEGKRVKWNLEIFPKETEAEEKVIKIALGIENFEYGIDTDDDMAQYQIETAYRIPHGSNTTPFDMSKVPSLSSYRFHSSMLKKYPYWWLQVEESYSDGAIEEKAVNGFLTFDFEIRTYLAPKIKCQFSTVKQDFLNNFGDFHLDGDVKIFCAGQEFRCHKLLLISQSPVFKAMFDQEGSKESRENAVDIQDCTPEAVLEFLFFLHNAMMRPFTDTSGDLELMFGLVHLTSKYQVKLLMSSCMDVLMNMMNTDNVLKIMVVVKKYEVGTEVSDMSCDFMKKNIAVIVEKEEWEDFVAEYPSLLKEFICNMNRKSESCDCDGNDTGQE